ncbi:MAG: STAS/SEC14 domain-containing protein [Candidatus Hydrogenedentes bacterium]|nr:STAS/SEC14 domain-containing protein [Candidatus Hydrogenedentota bacterium]
MPAASAPFDLDVGERYITVHFPPGAAVTPTLVSKAIRAEFDLPEYPERNDLWDLRGTVMTRAIDSDSLSLIVEFISAEFPAESHHRKTALVVDTDLAFGIARMFQMLGDELPFEVEIFKDAAEAVAWLEAE